MKKHLAFLLTLCLILTVLTPMFTLAEELDTAKPTEECIESPLASALPSPSDSVPPSPSDSVPPSPSDSVPPSPSDSVPPSPTDSVPPSPSDSVPPSPSESSSPVPSPSPSATPNPYEDIKDPKVLYDAFSSMKDTTEIENFFASLSEEQIAALKEYVQSLFDKTYVTVPFTNAGPMISRKSSSDNIAPSKNRRSLMPTNITSPKDVTKDTAGVELSKTVSKISDNLYSVRLESYTTGEVTTIPSAPTDIVLVLDQSGSMKESYNGGSSKQAAMKSAVDGFIASFINKPGDFRIGIVTFGTTASLIGAPENPIGLTNQYSKLKTLVGQLPNNPEGSTRVDLGMNIANQLLNNPNDVNHNKVVIVFTDGVPTDGQEFNTTVANNALATASTLKAAGATIYTVGIFTGAYKERLHGDTYVVPGSWGLEEIPCNGIEGDKWSARQGLFSGGDVHAADVDAGNKFLNYLSTNYYTSKIELTRTTKEYHILIFPVSTYIIYEIGKPCDRLYSNYYLAADNASNLNTAFTSISTQISNPTTPLGDDVEIRDTVSQYFDSPIDIRDISVYTVDCIGKSDEDYDWSDTMNNLSADISINSNTILVSGFSYDQNYVSGDIKPETQDHGRKLVITFNIAVKSGFWGGNQVPTNESSSGLYASEALTENFVRPTVDIPLNVPFEGKSINVYLGNTVATSDLYNPITAPTGSDEWKGHFIDIGGITYSATFDAKPTGDLSPVTVTATVRSRINPELGAKNVPANASITVYKPEITFCDSSIYLGEKAEYTGNLVSVSWKHGTTVADPAGILGTAPALAYTYGPVADWIEQDTAVDVTAKISDWDITQYVTFANDGSSHAGSAVDKEFTVLVTPCTLTVSKIGCSGAYGDNQTFILHVTGTNLTDCDFADEVNLTVVVKGNDSKTIVGLPVGIYTVTENSGWSWRYSATTGTATLSPDRTNSKADVTVTNSLTELGKLWLSASNWMQNVFNKKAGVSA